MLYPTKRARIVALALGLCVTGATCSAASSSPSSSRRTATTAAAAGAAFPVSVSSGKGRVTIPARPTAIVSLSPTATEMLFAIGAGSHVIAVDDQSTYPPNAPKSQLSGFKPNVEAIAAKKPDLVVISNDEAGLSAALARIGIPVIVDPATTTLDGVYAEISGLGMATGHLAEANGLVTSMRSEISQIVASTPHPPRPLRYYYELDQTFYSATSSTFIGQLFKLLGASNIADAADKTGSGYPQLSAEYIVAANPDVVFLADVKCCQQTKATVAARPGWSQMTAVKHGEIVLLDDDIASRWGPRVVDLVRAISQGMSAASLAA